MDEPVVHVFTHFRLELDVVRGEVSASGDVVTRICSLPSSDAIQMSVSRLSVAVSVVASV